ncbi:DUF533 domain-containing protein [Silanimonas sp.]|jgi:uncharacterized membrane protein YebE (DUF533 family)|uniref:DUF533 domain-containing protein n=1 Tax=Silanimonas sp. TaxID=1929290 RepID=UPI0022CC4C56|nr:DUF533 domain-containing protein [Silanimonas sp.]MCZ8114381.1 DUF533 domain-containing protein [Silanimonas sp.]
MFDPERLLKQVMNEALSGSLGGKQRRHKSSYGSSGLGGLGGLLGGSSSGSSSGSGGLGSLLGGVLGSGSGRRSSGGLSTATKAKIGMGALGLAIAAYEHYKSSNRPAATASAPPPQPMHGGTPPPPPPPAAAGSPPPAPGTAGPTDAERAVEAMHLLRAMICAANADGLIDADERQRILGSARDAGLDAEDLEALEGELAAPLTAAQLVARTRPTQREQVYVASVIAIGRDTELEVRYLDDLAQRLGLDAAAREQLHAELGL